MAADVIFLFCPLGVPIFIALAYVTGFVFAKPTLNRQSYTFPS